MSHFEISETEVAHLCSVGVSSLLQILAYLAAFRRRADGDPRTAVYLLLRGPPWCEIVRDSKHDQDLHLRLCRVLNVVPSGKSGRAVTDVELWLSCRCVLINVTHMTGVRRRSVRLAAWRSGRRV